MLGKQTGDDGLKHSEDSDSVQPGAKGDHLVEKYRETQGPKKGGVNWLLFVPVIIVSALLGVAAQQVWENKLKMDAGLDPNELTYAQAGQAAPDVALEPLGNLPVFDRAVLEAPGIKLVNYWASWCAPCRAEHPVLTALAEEGVPIYGINYKDTPPNALAFLDELGDPYTGHGADPNGRVALDWGLYGVPETFVVDGEGRVLLRHAGPVTSQVIEAKIRPLLSPEG